MYRIGANTYRSCPFSFPSIVCEAIDLEPDCHPAAGVPLKLGFVPRSGIETHNGGGAPENPRAAEGPSSRGQSRLLRWHCGYPVRRVREGRGHYLWLPGSALERMEGWFGSCPHTLHLFHSRLWNIKLCVDGIWNMKLCVDGMEMAFEWVEVLRISKPVCRTCLSELK
jgi:hypothetical protein